MDSNIPTEFGEKTQNAFFPCHRKIHFPFCPWFALDRGKTILFVFLDQKRLKKTKMHLALEQGQKPLI